MLSFHRENNQGDDDDDDGDDNNDDDDGDEDEDDDKDDCEDSRLVLNVEGKNIVLDDSHGSVNIQADQLIIKLPSSHCPHKCPHGGWQGGSPVVPEVDPDDGSEAAP